MSVLPIRGADGGSVAGIPGAAVRDARTDAVAASHLVERSAWSVVWVGGASPETAHGWEALRLVLGRSPRAWLLRCVPGPALGSRVYGWLAVHRGALGALGGAVIGRAGRRLGVPGAVVEGAALAVVLAWEFGLVRDACGVGGLPGWVRSYVATLGLSQYWSMFSPHPPRRDVWHLVPALKVDGVVVELLSGADVVLEAPVDGPRHYGGYRWRQAVRRAQERGELHLLAEYWCRSGPWAALDVWELARPSLGTAGGRYQAGPVLRWECPEAELGAPVRSFQEAVRRQVTGRGAASASAP